MEKKQFSNSFDKNIIYEDNHLLVAFKPSGMLSQKDITDDPSILEKIKDYISHKYKKPGNVFLGSVHRLDRPAMGLMVFAKTSKALSRLNESFRKGEVDKVYYAVTEGVPGEPTGSLIDYLIKDTKLNRVKAYDKPGTGSKKAKLHYELIAHQKGMSLLRVRLETGRPHQIRVQLSKRGWPIAGDLKYGSSVHTKDKSICLMSASLKLIHPVQKEMMFFKAQFPYERSYWCLFKNLDL